MHADEEQKEIRERQRKKYANLLLNIVDNEPSQYGYECGGWTSARLVTYLEKEMGIKLSSSQINSKVF